jgi:hypothetical protein
VLAQLLPEQAESPAQPNAEKLNPEDLNAEEGKGNSPTAQQSRDSAEGA